MFSGTVTIATLARIVSCAVVTSTPLTAGLDPDASDRRPVREHVGGEVGSDRRGDAGRAAAHPHGLTDERLGARAERRDLVQQVQRPVPVLIGAGERERVEQHVRTHDG